MLSKQNLSKQKEKEHESEQTQSFLEYFNHAQEIVLEKIYGDVLEIPHTATKIIITAQSLGINFAKYYMEETNKKNPYAWQTALMESGIETMICIISPRLNYPLLISKLCHDWNEARVGEKYAAIFCYDPKEFQKVTKIHPEILLSDPEHELDRYHAIGTIKAFSAGYSAFEWTIKKVADTIVHFPSLFSSPLAFIPCVFLGSNMLHRYLSHTPTFNQINYLHFSQIFATNSCMPRLHTDTMIHQNGHLHPLASRLLNQPFLSPFFNRVGFLNTSFPRLNVYNYPYIPQNNVLPQDDKNTSQKQTPDVIDKKTPTFANSTYIASCSQPNYDKNKASNKNWDLSLEGVGGGIALTLRITPPFSWPFIIAGAGILIGGVKLINWLLNHKKDRYLKDTTHDIKKTIIPNYNRTINDYNRALSLSNPEEQKKAFIAIQAQINAQLGDINAKRKDASHRRHKGMDKHFYNDFVIPTYNNVETKTKDLLKNLDTNIKILDIKLANITTIELWLDSNNANYDRNLLLQQHDYLSRKEIISCLVADKQANNQTIISLLDNNLKYHSENHDCRLNRASKLFAIGNTTEALKDFEYVRNNCKDDDNKYFAASLSMAEWYNSQKLYEKAATIIQGTKQKFANDKEKTAILLEEEGLIQQKQGNLIAAIATLDQALKLQPGNTEISNRLLRYNLIEGQLLLSQNNYDDAFQYFKYVQAQSESNNDMYFEATIGHAQCLAHQNLYSLALKMLLPLVTDKLSTEKLMHLLLVKGCILMQEGTIGSAKALFIEVLEKQPKNVTALRNLTICNARLINSSIIEYNAYNTANAVELEIGLQTHLADTLPILKKLADLTGKLLTDYLENIGKLNLLMQTTTDTETKQSCQTEIAQLNIQVQTIFPRINEVIFQEKSFVPRQNIFYCNVAQLIADVAFNILKYEHLKYIDSLPKFLHSPSIIKHVEIVSADVVRIVMGKYAKEIADINKKLSDLTLQSLNLNDTQGALLNQTLSPTLSPDSSSTGSHETAASTEANQPISVNDKKQPSPNKSNSQLKANPTRDKKTPDKNKVRQFLDRTEAYYMIAHISYNIVQAISASINAYRQFTLDIKACQSEEVARQSTKQHHSFHLIFVKDTKKWFLVTTNNENKKIVGYFDELVAQYPRLMEIVNKLSGKTFEEILLMQAELKNLIMSSVGYDETNYPKLKFINNLVYGALETYSVANAAEELISAFSVISLSNVLHTPAVNFIVNGFLAYLDRESATTNFTVLFLKNFCSNAGDVLLSSPISSKLLFFLQHNCTIATLTAIVMNKIHINQQTIKDFLYYAARCAKFLSKFLQPALLPVSLYVNFQVAKTEQLSRCFDNAQLLLKGNAEQLLTAGVAFAKIKEQIKYDRNFLNRFGLQNDILRSLYVWSVYYEHVCFAKFKPVEMIAYTKNGLYASVSIYTDEDEQKLKEKTAAYIQQNWNTCLELQECRYIGENEIFALSQILRRPIFVTTSNQQLHSYLHILIDDEHKNSKTASYKILPGEPIFISLDLASQNYCALAITEGYFLITNKYAKVLENRIASLNDDLNLEPATPVQSQQTPRIDDGFLERYSATLRQCRVLEKQLGLDGNMRQITFTESSSNTTQDTTTVVVAADSNSHVERNSNTASNCSICTIF